MEDVGKWNKSNFAGEATLTAYICVFSHPYMNSNYDAMTGEFEPGRIIDF